MLEICRYWTCWDWSLKMLCKSMNSIPFFFSEKKIFLNAFCDLFQNRLMDEEHAKYNI